MPQTNTLSREQQQAIALAQAKRRRAEAEGVQPAPVQPQAPAPRLSTPDELSAFAPRDVLSDIAGPKPAPQVGTFRDAGTPSLKPKPQPRTVAQAETALTPAGAGFEMVPDNNRNSVGMPELRGSMTEAFTGPPGYEPPPEGMKYVLTQKSLDGSADQYELAPLARGDEGTFEGTMRVIGEDLNKTRKAGLQHYARAGLGLAEGIGNLPGDAADWMASFSGGGKWRDPSPRVDLSGLKPEIPAELESVSGYLAEGFMQYLGARGLMGASKTIPGEVARSAVATGVGFAGDSGRAADMVPLDRLPEGTVRDFVGWLQTNPDDSGMLGRVKNFSEDAIANLLFMGMGAGVKQGAKLGSKAVGQVLAPRPRPAPTGGPANAIPGQASGPVPVAQAPIPQGPGRAAQPGATGAGQQAPAGPPPVLNAVPAQPAAISKQQRLVDRDTIKITRRIMRSAGVRDADVMGYLSGAMQRFKGLNNPRIPLAFFLKSDLPNHFPEQVANQVGTNLDVWGRARNAETGVNDTSRATINKTVRDLRKSQQDFLTQSAERNLFKGSLIGQEDQIVASLRETGRKGYEPVLDNARQAVDGRRAPTPDEAKAIAEIREVLSDPLMMGYVDDATRIRAKKDGIDIDDMMEQDPIGSAHWLQSEFRRLSDAAEDAVTGKPTRMSQAYDDLREMVLDPLKRAAPGYEGAMNRYGHLFGAKDAVKFGKGIFTAGRSAYDTAQKVRQFKKLGRRQQTVAWKSIRDEYLNEFRGTPEDAAAKVTRMQSEGALDILEQLGPRGKRFADDIRSIAQVENANLRAIDQGSGSPTYDNKRGGVNAQDMVQSPINQTIGAFGQKGSIPTTLMGDVILATQGVPPLLTLGKGVAWTIDKFGNPSKKVLARATEGLYGLPKGNALVAPGASRRVSGPRSSAAAALEAEEAEDMAELLRALDLVEKNPKTRGGQKGKAILDKIDAAAKAPGNTTKPPPAKTGGRPPPGTVSQSPAAVMSALVSGVTAYAATDGDPTATLLAAAGGGYLGNKLSKGGAKPPRVKAAVGGGQKPAPVRTAPEPEAPLSSPYTQRQNPVADMQEGAQGQAAARRQLREAEQYRLKAPDAELADLDDEIAGLRDFLGLEPKAPAPRPPRPAPVAPPAPMPRAREPDAPVSSPYGERTNPAADMGDALEGRAAAQRQLREAQAYRKTAPQAELEALDQEIADLREFLGLPASKPPPVANGFGSKLPMDEGARMQRAREMGFDVDTPLYHGTSNQPFEAFSGPTYFSTLPKEADIFAGSPIDETWNPHVIPAYAKGELKSISIDEMEGLGYKPEAIAKLEADGFAGARSIDGQVLIFDPSNIRGKFAKFDPAESQSSKLLAGVGNNQGAAMAGTGAAGAILAPDQNGDGVDAMDRAAGFFGGAFTAGVASTAARGLGNKLRGAGGRPPPGGSRAPAQASFGGPVGARNLAAKGETRPQQALDMAEEMAARGASRDEIWDATAKLLDGTPYAGAVAGRHSPDGKPRFEIDDSGARFTGRTGEPYTAPLEDVLDDASAGGAYPMARDLETYVDPNMHTSGYGEAGRRIRIGGGDPRSAALHERQHYVQKREDFASGGSDASERISLVMDSANEFERASKSFFDYADGHPKEYRLWEDMRREKLLNGYSNRYDKLVAQLSKTEAGPTIQRLFDEREAAKNLMERGPRSATISDRYNRLAGEVESRNVEARRDFSPAERRAKRPWETQDVPDNQQIVRFGSGKAESRPPAKPAPGGKAPPRPVLGGRVIKQLQKAAKALPPEVRNKLKANAELPSGARKSVAEASGDDPSIYGVVAPFQHAKRGPIGSAASKVRSVLGRPLRTMPANPVDTGVSEGIARVERNVGPPRSLDPIAEVAGTAEKRRRAAVGDASRWNVKTNTQTREALGLPEKPVPKSLARNEQEATELAISARRALAAANLEATSAQEARRWAEQRKAAIIDALLNQPASAQRPGATGAGVQIGAASSVVPPVRPPKPVSYADARDMADLIFNAENAKTLEDVLSGRVKPRSRDKYHMALLALAGVPAVGGGLLAVANDLEGRKQPPPKDTYDPQPYMNPGDPRYVWDWDKVKTNRRAVQAIQINLNALPPNQDGARYNLSVDAWGPKSEAAFKHWQYENGFNPDGVMTAEQWELLDSQALAARRSAPARTGQQR